MKLQAIATEYLQYLESSQFITRLFNDMKSTNVDTSKDKEMDDRFQLLKKQSEEFYQALNQIRAMAESKQLEELDLVRDQKIATIRLHIAAFRYRSEKEIKNAFAAAQIILDKFQEIDVLNYEAESTAIQKFLDEWHKGEHAEHVKALGLELQLNNLKAAAAEFDNVFNSRSAITTSKEVYNVKLLNRTMLATYSSLARYVVAMTEFKKDENLYPKLLDAFNNGRKYFADVIARRKGKGGDAEEGKKVE